MPMHNQDYPNGSPSRSCPTKRRSGQSKAGRPTQFGLFPFESLQDIRPSDQRVSSTGTQARLYWSFDIIWFFCRIEKGEISPSGGALFSGTKEPHRILNVPRLRKCPIFLLS